MTDARPNSRRLGRSAGAILLGVVVVVVLSLGTDEVFHLLGVFPPLDQPMHESRLLLLAFAYRTIYGVIGGYVSARLAPYAPMNHALVYGVIGFVLSAIGAITMRGLGPDWYPISLVVTALPGAWLGGCLERKLHGKH